MDLNKKVLIIDSEHRWYNQIGKWDGYTRYSMPARYQVKIGDEIEYLLKWQIKELNDGKQDNNSE